MENEDKYGKLPDINTDDIGRGHRNYEHGISSVNSIPKDSVQDGEHSSSVPTYNPDTGSRRLGD
jgi:hypothetical protein